MSTSFSEVVCTLVLLLLIRHCRDTRAHVDALTQRFQQSQRLRERILLAEEGKGHLRGTPFLHIFRGILDAQIKIQFKEGLVPIKDAVVAFRTELVQFDLETCVDAIGHCRILKAFDPNKRKIQFVGQYKLAVNILEGRKIFTSGSCDSRVGDSAVAWHGSTRLDGAAA